MYTADIELLHTCFSRAIYDVFTTMVGQEPCEIKTEQAERGEITGMMSLLGEKNALLCLNLSKENTAVIVSCMTGILVEELQAEDLYDGIAELVNMVAGRAKALLASTGYHYRLMQPLTVVGENHFIVYKRKTPQLTLHFTLGEMNLLFELTYL